MSIRRNNIFILVSTRPTARQPPREPRASWREMWTPPATILTFVIIITAGGPGAGVAEPPMAVGLFKP